MHEEARIAGEHAGGSPLVSAAYDGTWMFRYANGGRVSVSWTHRWGYEVAAQNGRTSTARPIELKSVRILPSEAQRIATGRGASSIGPRYELSVSNWNGALTWKTPYLLKTFRVLVDATSGRVEFRPTFKTLTYLYVLAGILITLQPWRWNASSFTNLASLARFDVGTSQDYQKVEPKAPAKDESLWLYRTDEYVERLRVYPIHDGSDIARVNQTLEHWQQTGSLVCPSSDANVEMPYEDLCLIAELTDLTPEHKAPESQVRLVSLSQSHMRPLSVLRDRIQLPAPAGDAVISIFPSKIPWLLYHYWKKRGEPLGLCIGRFVAIFPSGNDIEPTIRHELVHAYIAAVAGARNEALPDWFREGMAIHLGSNSFSQAQVVGADQFLITRLTDDYIDYKRLFDWLDDSLGSSRFARAVTESIFQGDTGPLVRAMGVNDYVQLVRKRDSDLAVKFGNPRLWSLLLTLVGWLYFRKGNYGLT